MKCPKEGCEKSVLRENNAHNDAQYVHVNAVLPLFYLTRFSAD